MPTPYSAVIKVFLHLVEKDVKFFKYYELTDEESELLVNTRCYNFLNEAINRLILEGDPTVDFTDRDDEAKMFNFELTPRELAIIPYLIYEQYLFRDVAYLKLLNVNYTTKESRVFDPSNARRTWHQDVFQPLCDSNKSKLEIYKNVDRVTGEFRGINFADYDIED